MHVSVCEAAAGSPGPAPWGHLGVLQWHPLPRRPHRPWGTSVPRRCPQWIPDVVPVVQAAAPGFPHWEDFRNRRGSLFQLPAQPGEWPAAPGTSETVDFGRIHAMNTGEPGGPLKRPRQKSVPRDDVRLRTMGVSQSVLGVGALEKHRTNMHKQVATAHDHDRKGLDTHHFSHMLHDAEEQVNALVPGAYGHMSGATTPEMDTDLFGNITKGAFEMPDSHVGV